MDYEKQAAAQMAQFAGKSLAPAQQPLGSLYEALKYLQSIADDIHTTTDRLCGTVPEDVGTEGQTSNSSVFSQIEDVARRIRETANRLSGDNQRVMSRL